MVRTSAAAAPTAPRSVAPLKLSAAVLEGLDADQRAAVLAPLGHVVRVSAGPGSGKTRVLTRRVQALSEQPSVSMRSVLALTFSKKAAGELRERLAALLGPELAFELSASTFHMWCARALHSKLGLSSAEFELLASSRLRELHGLAPDAALPEKVALLARRLDASFSIADTDESRRVLKELVPSLQREMQQTKELARLIPSIDWSPAALLSAISLHKTKRTLRHDALGQAAAEHPPPFLALLLRAYDSQLVSRNALDFNDLLHYTLRALRELPRAAALARARWTHLLVDEWQDTDGVMFEIIRELAAPLAAPAAPIDGASAASAALSRSLFVVGDKDQSIYAFRGAAPSNLAALEVDFKHAFLSYALPNNYRSTPQITTVASAILGRKGATVAACAPAALGAASAAAKPPKKGASAAEPRQVLVVATENDEQQAQYVVRTISSIANVGNAAAARRGSAEGETSAGAGAKGVPLSEICVLARTNREVVSLEAAFIEGGVPYVLVGGTALFARQEVKDALAHVRLAIGAGELGALERAAATPKRGLGKATLALFASWLEESSRAQAAQRFSARDLLLALAPKPALTELAAVDPALDLAALAAVRTSCPLAPPVLAKLAKFGGVVARARARAYGGPQRLAAAVEAVLDESGVRAHYAERAAATRASADVAARAAAAASLAAVPGAAEAGLVAQEDGGAAEAAEAAALQLERLDSLVELAGADEELTPKLEDVLSFIASATLDDGASRGTAPTATGGGEGARSEGAEQEAPVVEAVRLMTMHRSKGLEFEVVFVTHCEDGSVPFRGRAGADLDHASLEEERRLLYVGATRAKGRLYFTWRKSKAIMGGGKAGKGFIVAGEISPFLAAVRADLRDDDSIGFKKLPTPPLKRSGAAGGAKTAVASRYENAQNRLKLREFERRYC